MISHYEATYLEHSIENMYLKNGITEPQHITIEKITAALNIWIYPSSQKARRMNQQRDYAAYFWIIACP